MKTTDELIEKADEIIDSLDNFNIAEKYHIISSLFETLKETIKKSGMEVLVDEED